MKLQTPLIVLATAALLSLGATAFAAPPTTGSQPTSTEKGPPTEQMDKTSTSADSSVSMQARFQALDTNGDGYIDKTEAASNSALLQQFDKLDVNHDGKLSPSEFANAKGIFGK
jgi:hypothetical protein